MRVFLRAKAMLDRLVDRVCMALIVFMTVTIFVSIVFRYVFNLPLAWAEEASRFSFIWMTLLGSVICLRERAHLGLDLLVSRAPAILRGSLKTASGVVVAIGAGVLFWYGLQLFEVASMQLSPAIGIPMTYVYAAMPISGLLMLLELGTGALLFACGGAPQGSGGEGP